MLTEEENQQVESAVRRLLAQATVTPAEISALLASLPRSRAAMDRALEVARELRWPGVPLLEAAIARLSPLPESAPRKAPDPASLTPRRPEPPPKLTSRMSIPAPPVPPEVAADLAPPPVKATSRMSIPVPAVPPEVAADLAPPPVKPPAAPPPPTGSESDPAARALEAALAAAAMPQSGETGKSSDPSVKFMRTTGKYRVVDNTPDLPPLKPATVSGPQPTVTKTPTGRVKADSSPNRKTQRIQAPEAAREPAPDWMKAMVGVCALGLGLWLSSGSEKAPLPSGQPKAPVKASVAAPAPLPPPGAPVEVEGVVVASAPGKVIVKTADRYYLLRGLRLPVGAKTKTRGILSGVGRDGVVLVDASA